MSVVSSKLTAPQLLAMKAHGQKIVVLTAYDATFARLFDEGGADVLLVGDSLGMVIQGLPNTLPVTLDEMIYHTRAVARGAQRAQVVADLPFMSYQVSPQAALVSAGRLVKEGYAEAVKLEGGVRSADAVRRIVEAGIPVMGHVGLTPQSVLGMGGFKVQGRQELARKQLLEDARVLEQAGAYCCVIEGVPEDLAREITQALTIPTIGIGAGLACDGQVLVCYDLLGLFRDLTPKFVKRYAELGAAVVSATQSFVSDVQAGTFPGPEHTFKALQRPLEPLEPTGAGPVIRAATPLYGPADDSQADKAAEPAPHNDRRRAPRSAANSASKPPISRKRRPIRKTNPR